VSEWQIVVTINTPHWDDDDKTYLAERIYNTVKQEVPKTDFVVEEFEK
jgi:hypothetical protein